MISTAQSKVTGPIIALPLNGASLVGTMVRFRPYYHVPTGTSSMEPARSPWTRRALVIDGNASSDVVTLAFFGDQTGPWGQRVFATIRELHDSRDCRCPACAPSGTGIHVHVGA